MPVDDQLKIPSYKKCEPVYTCGTKKHIANLHYSEISPDALGTIIGIHGHGGCQYDTSLNVFAQRAPHHGFNFVAIESLPFSITNDHGIRHDPSKATLKNHKSAVMNSIFKIHQRHRWVIDGYNIVVAHSMASRAMTDLALAAADAGDISFVARMFQEYSFVNPYFVSLNKLLAAVKKKKSPEDLEKFLTYPKCKERNIRGADYNYHVHPGDFYIPFDAGLNIDGADFDAVAKLVADRLIKHGDNQKLINIADKKVINLFLGTGDREADYNQSKTLVEKINLNPRNTNFYLIENGDHHMDNVADDYRNCVDQSLARAALRAKVRTAS